MARGESCARPRLTSSQSQAHEQMTQVSAARIAVARAAALILIGLAAYWIFVGPLGLPAGAADFVYVQHRLLI